MLLNQSCAQGPVFRSASAVQSALARVASVYAEHSKSPRRVGAAPLWPHRLASVGDAFTLAPPKLAGFAACPPRAPLAFNNVAVHGREPEEAWRDQVMEIGFLGTGASRPSK